MKLTMLQAEMRTVFHKTKTGMVLISVINYTVLIFSVGVKKQFLPSSQTPKEKNHNCFKIYTVTKQNELPTFTI